MPMQQLKLMQLGAMREGVPPSSKASAEGIFSRSSGFVTTFMSGEISNSVSDTSFYDNRRRLYRRG